MLIRAGHRRQAGATLLELMVTVAILGILMAIGMPSLRDWILRNSVTVGAEGLQNGLRQAEAEAIRRNARVEFLLTNDKPSVATISSLSAAGNGQNWAVRVLDSSFKPLADTALAYVAGQPMSEVSSDLTITGPASVVFSGTGRGSTIDGVGLTEYQIYRVSRSGADRALCVFVTPGGAVKMCDPSAASGTPYACAPLVPASSCPQP
jgi:type IV fimbrial biogenesis protein FimT